LIRQKVQHIAIAEMWTMKIVLRGPEPIYGSELGTPGECERYTTKEMVTHDVAR
jgi:hypothetical protein